MWCGGRSFFIRCAGASWYVKFVCWNEIMLCRAGTPPAVQCWLLLELSISSRTDGVLDSWSSHRFCCRFVLLDRVNEQEEVNTWSKESERGSEIC